MQRYERLLFFPSSFYIYIYIFCLFVEQLVIVSCRVLFNMWQELKKGVKTEK